MLFFYYQPNREASVDKKETVACFIMDYCFEISGDEIGHLLCVSSWNKDHLLCVSCYPV